MQVTLIDYKAGNVASVVKALEHLGADTHVTDAARDVAVAEMLVLPGVGHFSATAALDPLRSAIIGRMKAGVPFLGICVGMQWLYQGSEESPDVPGFGLFPGTVERFPSRFKVPHVGWNQLSHRSKSTLLSGLPTDSYAYFTHSYYCPVDVDTTATTNYGVDFASVCELADPTMKVFGVQFHVEKSGDAGLKILRNFLLLSDARNAH